MPISIKNQTNSVQIDDNEFPKNSLYIKVNEKEKTVAIKKLNDDTVVTSSIFSDYLDGDSSNQNYASLSSLVSSLRTRLFK